MERNPMDNDSRLAVRSWNGTPIQRRTTDGYVNATAMCKANGKQWNDYWRTDRATEYLEALSAETGIPVSSLCLSLRGGSQQGTWVHPQAAIDLARWISAPFAVWMDGWFLEEFKAQVSQARGTQPLLPDVLHTVEQSIDLLERLGGVDDRAQLLLRDIVLNHAARAAGGVLALPESHSMLSLQEAFQQLAGATPHQASKLATQFGRQFKALYREENGRPPKTHKQLVHGRSCDVCDYEINWLQQHLDDLKRAVAEVN